jgi:hypothetical protein
MVEGVETASTKSLGVRLTAEDVATGIWDATRKRGRLPKVHYDIGTQAKVFATVAKYAPNWAVRTANKYFSGS